MDIPQISIIMPVYQAEKYLAEAILSIQAQTIPNWELLLINDGSTDGSAAIGDKFATSDPRINILHQPNSGQASARNAGLAMASGKYVAFMDSDDVLLPHMYETLLCEAEKGNYDFVRCNFARFYKDDVKTLVAEQEIPARMDSREEVFQKMLLPMIGETGRRTMFSSTACTTLYRRNLIQKHKLIFPSERLLQSEDLAFNLHFFTHAKSGVRLAEALYLYRYHKTSFSNTYTSGRVDKLLQLDAFLLNMIDSCFFQEYMVTGNLRPRVDARLLDSISVCAKNIALQATGRGPAAQELAQLIDIPRVQEALFGPAGRGRGAVLGTWCFFMRRRWFGLFRLVVIFLKRQD